MADRRWFVGVSGASGAPVTIELLQQLPDREGPGSASDLFQMGSGYSGARGGCHPPGFRGAVHRAYDEEDRGAAPASGSFSAVGMAVVP